MAPNRNEGHHTAASEVMCTFGVNRDITIQTKINFEVSGYVPGQGECNWHT